MHTQNLYLCRYSVTLVQMLLFESSCDGNLANRDLLVNCYQNVAFVLLRMVPCLLLDCVFITLSLLVGMYSLKSSKEIRDQIDE